MRSFVVICLIFITGALSEHFLFLNNPSIYDTRYDSIQRIILKNEFAGIITNTNQNTYWLKPYDSASSSTIPLVKFTTDDKTVFRQVTKHTERGTVTKETEEFFDSLNISNGDSVHIFLIPDQTENNLAGKVTKVIYSDI